MSNGPPRINRERSNTFNPAPAPHVYEELHETGWSSHMLTITKDHSVPPAVMADAFKLDVPQWLEDLHVLVESLFPSRTESPFDGDLATMVFDAKLRRECLSFLADHAAAIEAAWRLGSGGAFIFELLYDEGLVQRSMAT